MDKAARDDVRRGGSSRFSLGKRQSDGGGDGVLIKSKREKLRRLSSVGNEMDHLSLSASASKRLKLPKKFFDDEHNAVDHSSVPRKLRSAIKKRACKSISPPLSNPRKLEHTLDKVEAGAKDCTKKVKSSMQQEPRGSQEHAAVGPITREEEEVVETLYSLAGMFHDNDKANDKTILKEKHSELKSLTLPVSRDEDSKIICQTSSTDAADRASNLVGPAVEAMKVQSSLETSDTDLVNSKQLATESDNAVPLVNLPMIPMFLKDDSTVERPSCNSMAKLPPWLVNATCATEPCASENVHLTEKDTMDLAGRKRSWKICAAHVYISQLIRVLKLTEGKENSRMKQPVQIQPDEGSKQEEALPATNNLHMVMNCSPEKSSNEVRNAILLHKRLIQDQQQACTTSGMYNSHKQRFDLSFSDGRSGVEAGNVANRPGNKLETSTQFHNSYLHLPAQNHMIMHQTLPQNWHCSTSYSDHLSAAAAHQVQMQLPPYYGTPFSSPLHSAAVPVLPKQQFWASAQVSPRYCPNEVAAAHLPSWQNRRHDYSPAMLSQTILPVPNPRSSADVLGSKYVQNSLLEVFGPKYVQISPQQQQFIPIASLLPPKRVKREPHCIPSGYEENGGLYFPDSTSLQLLCNEHL